MIKHVCANEDEIVQSRDDITYFFITLKNLTKNIQLSFINIVALSAMVRKTGLFLHESTGDAGTIQQIDFATKKQSNEVA